MDATTKAECSGCGLPATVERSVDVNRTAYRYGAEFEEDVPVRRHYCAEHDPEAEQFACDGCSEDHGDVRLVTFRREAGGPWYLARWCPGCRHLGALALAGETSHGAAGLEPVTDLIVWTGHTFRCSCCQRKCRASEAVIAEFRENYAIDPDTTDAEVAASVEFCLACTDAETIPGEHVGGEG